MNAANRALQKWDNGAVKFNRWLDETGARTDPNVRAILEEIGPIWKEQYDKIPAIAADMNELGRNSAMIHDGLLEIVQHWREKHPDYKVKDGDPPRQTKTHGFAINAIASIRRAANYFGIVVGGKGGEGDSTDPTDPGNEGGSGVFGVG